MMFYRVLSSLRPRLPLAAALALIGACSGPQSGANATGADGPSGALTPGARDTGPTRATPQPPTPLTDADGRTFDVERVDHAHLIISHEVLLQMMMDASTGALPIARDGRGYVVTDAPSDSLLAALDVRAGDEVLDVDGAPLTSADDARRAFAKVRANGHFTLAVRRAGKRVEQSYLVRTAMDQWMGIYIHMSRMFGMYDSLIDKESSPVIDALHTGVRERAPGHYDIDPQVLRVFQDEPQLFEDSMTAPSLELDGSFTGTGKSPYRVLRLSPYYLVTRVAGRTIEGTNDLDDAVRALAGKAEFTIDVALLGKRITLRYSAVDGLLDRDKLARAQSDWKQWTERNPPKPHRGLIDLGDPEPEPEPWPSGSTENQSGSPSSSVQTPGLTTEELDRNITKVSEFEYKLKRALRDRIIADPDLMSRGARVVPSVRSGRANGFKLYAIRPSSALARLGLRNGDTVRTINGTALTSPDKALDVFQQARTADRITIEVLRRGKRAEIVINVVP